MNRVLWFFDRPIDQVREQQPQPQESLFQNSILVGQTYRIFWMLHNSTFFE